MKNIRLISISIFDHWLTEQEAIESKIITYETARERDAINEYMLGEIGFIDLYRSIGSHASCLYRNQKVKVLETRSKKFESYLTKGLREQGFSRHNITYLNEGIKVEGGYDRTDTLLMDADNDDIDIPKLFSKIERSGLFVLGNEVMDHQAYLDSLVYPESIEEWL